MKEQNRITEAASENRKRGRPPIDIGTTSCLDGTRRTQVNAKYMFEAINIISEAASEIPSFKPLRAGAVHSPDILPG